MSLTGCDRSTPPSSGSGAGTSACDPTTATCPFAHVHTVLAIKEVAFMGNNLVEKDTLGNFPSPEWVEGRAQADQAPVSYAQNRKVQLTAKFRVARSPSASEVVEIVGTATFGSARLIWNGTVTVNPVDTEVTTALLTSGAALPNHVECYESGDIAWQFNPDGTGLVSAGTSRNVLYATLGDPTISPNYWTLLDISCRGAAGKSAEDDFVKASFNPFHGNIGDGKGFKRKRDGTELTYYKNGGGTPSSGVFSCSDILSRADGTGRCGAWARFLVAMHQVHGVTSSAVFGVVPIDADLLIVKNCTFVGAGSLPPPFTHKGNLECTKNDGIFGQGKNNPQFTFGDHALVKHSTGIYDPSYGVGPKSDLKAWEDGGIAGIGQMPITSFTYSGDPHFLPGACSSGFIVYTAVAGDTLASIAAKFGVASDVALYNHAYNAAFRTSHPPPASVRSGDVVLIPRSIASKVAILKIA